MNFMHTCMKSLKILGCLLNIVHANLKLNDCSLYQEKNKYKPNNTGFFIKKQ